MAVTRLTELTGVLESQADRSEGLRNCWTRGIELLDRLGRWQEDEDQDTGALGRGLRPLGAPERDAAVDRGHLPSPDQRQSARVDFHVGDAVGGRAISPTTSARWAWPMAPTAFWESPFDYQNQALLYVPEKLPEPNTEDYTRAVVEAALPVIEAAEGRTFFLFTSLRAMREARELMETGMKRMGMDYPLLMQGEGSRTELLERFRKLGNAVLLGSQSFWEGVDVRGEALSLVIIDRLPFAPPDDPVLAARIEKMNSEGRNAFMEYQVPQAVITLKQGAGG